VSRQDARRPHSFERVAWSDVAQRRGDLSGDDRPEYAFVVVGETVDVDNGLSLRLMLLRSLPRAVAEPSFVPGERCFGRSIVPSSVINIPDTATWFIRNLH
jgi:hypothetical protein